MQITEVDRRITHSGQVVSEYSAGKLSVQLVGTFANKVTLDDLLYSVGSQKITARLGQKRDNIVLTGGNSIIKVGE